MPATMTDDLLAHLAAVRDREGEPDNADLLVLADRLQEEGDDDRAELVRVQCRMEAIRRECRCGACVKLRGGGQHHNGPCGIDRRQDDGVKLRMREYELLSRNPAWLSVQCPECKGEGWVPGGNRDSRVRGCGLCGGAYLRNGTGDLLRRLVEHTVRGRRGERYPSEPRATLTRGFVTVTLPSTLCWREWANPDSATAYTVHPVLAAVLASPVGPWVRRVVVSDREPYHNGAGWCWYNAARTISVLARRAAPVPDAAELPQDVFECLSGWATDHTQGTRWRPYPTAESAVDALARAVPLWSRAISKPY